MKRRIVVEVEVDDYRTLSFIKSLLGLEWRDLLIAGAAKWADEFQLEEKIAAIKQMLKEEEKTKEGGDGDV